jgi:hypothetical protein
VRTCDDWSGESWAKADYKGMVINDVVFALIVPIRRDAMVEYENMLLCHIISHCKK